MIESRQEAGKDLEKALQALEQTNTVSLLDTRTEIDYDKTTLHETDFKNISWKRFADGGKVNRFSGE